MSALFLKKKKKERKEKKITILLKKSRLVFKKYKITEKLSEEKKTHYQTFEALGLKVLPSTSYTEVLATYCINLNN